MARGDHIKVSRGLYTHHGIDIGRGRVIHFSGEPTRKRAAAVCVETLERFAGGATVEVVRKAKQKEVASIVQRARKCLGQRGYDLVVNNCEHFASWCATGRRSSAQVEPARTALDTAAFHASVGKAPRAAGRSPARARRGRSTSQHVKAHLRSAGIDAAFAASLSLAVEVASGNRNLRELATHTALAAAGGAARAGAQRVAEHAIKKGVEKAVGKVAVRSLVRATGAEAVKRAAAQGAGAVFRTTLRGNAVGAVAALVIEQAADTVQLARGKIDHAEYGKRSAENVASSAGGLGGAAAGAAIGTFICPGAGTVIGGLVGGLAGSIGAAFGLRKAIR